MICESLDHEQTDNDLNPNQETGIFSITHFRPLFSLSQSNMQVNAIQQLWVIVFQRLDKRAKERRHKKRSQMTCSLKYNNFLPPLNFSQFTVKVIT